VKWRQKTKKTRYSLKLRVQKHVVFHPIQFKVVCGLFAASGPPQAAKPLKRAGPPFAQSNKL
jgi:hypothetical protein